MEIMGRRKVRGIGSEFFVSMRELLVGWEILRVRENVVEGAVLRKPY